MRTIRNRRHHASVKKSVRLPEPISDAVEELAKKTGWSYSKVLARLILYGQRQFEELHVRKFVSQDEHQGQRRQEREEEEEDGKPVSGERLSQKYMRRVLFGDWSKDGYTYSGDSGWTAV